MATCFVLRSDPDRCKVLLQDLKRLENLGRDEYPKTLTKAFDLLVRESGECDTVRLPSNRHRVRRGRGGRGHQSFIFAQKGHSGRSGYENENSTCSRSSANDTDEIVSGIDGETCPNIACYGCDLHGHYRSACLCTTQTGVVSMHVGHVPTQDDCFGIL